MRAMARQLEHLRMNREIRVLWGLLTVVLMSACSSSGSVDIGHGQSGGGTTDFGIAYIKRTLPVDPVALDALRNLDDLTHQRPFWSKADVYIRDKATPSGVERNITAPITGTDFYDVRDLDVSADGTRLLFAMRGPIDPMMKDFAKPTWRIWEYDIAADNLHSLTDDVTADEGQDLSPHYLPLDSTHPLGRILITSTRQRYSKQVLLAEGKGTFEAQTEDGNESAFTLNVLDPTATGVNAFQQISFNQSHDLNPTVLSGGRISLKISTEISELTTQGAFTLGGTGTGTSLTIPALTVRRAETSIELPSGGSMMIAGLIQQTTRENLDALPGVGAMPVIGSLFRSRDFLSGDTEMVVIVTAYIVDPRNPGAFQTPADGLQFASDAETLLFGKLNKVVGAPPGANAGRAYQGPIGYVIE